MKKQAFSLFLAAVLPLAAYAAPPDTTADLQHALDSFMKSPAHDYAPATASRAQALAGAALLAEEQHDEARMQESIAAAEKTLEEARRNAALFREKFANLIALRQAARETMPYTESEGPTSRTDPKRLMRDAESRFDQTVQALESGQPGQAQQHAAEAHDAFTRVIDKAIPDMIDQAGETTSRAAASGAKRYAPITYQKAKDAREHLQQYLDGIQQATPLHPARAVHLAEAARNLANRVKSWRRHTGSHEERFLKAQHDRQRLAEILGIEIKDPALDDVNIDALAARAQQVMDDLKELRKRNRDMKANLQAEYEQKLQQQLDEMKRSLESRKNEQLSNMKEAFRAKLERETFEVKRQKKLNRLFKPDEIQVLANVDGSLLLRLSSLKFPSGSSKINPDYYDLLGRVKEALALYGDRKVRIEGHTDNKGDVKLNRDLSLKRAEAVRDFLIAAGVPGDRLKALGYGEVRPVASNEFAKGRAMNRRIDIVIEAPHD